MIERISRRKLSDEISSSILEMIHREELIPGERLPPENDLSESFGVSRTAVREGIKSLIAVGILEIRPGIGTFITESQIGPLRNPNCIATKQQVVLLELLEFRKIVEPETAALAAQRREPDDLRELKRCVSELEIGILNRQKPPEDIGFHLALAQATKNSAIMDAVFLIFRFYQNDPSLPDDSDLEAHRSVYEAVRNRNPARARQAMLDHFISLEKRYRTKPANFPTIYF